VFGSMACDEDERCHDSSGYKNAQHESRFRSPIGLELRRKRSIGETRELTAPNELSESRSSDTLEVARARTAKRFVGRRVARCESLSELAPSPDGSCHEEDRGNQPGEGDDGEYVLELHAVQRPAFSREPRDHGPSPCRSAERGAAAARPCWPAVGCGPGRRVTEQSGDIR